MKRLKLLLAIITVLSLLLTACGVPQKYYDSLQADHDALQIDYEELSAEFESLQSEHESLQSEYNELEVTYNGLREEYIKDLTDMSDDAIISWATVSFGDNSVCVLSDDKTYFQCLSGDAYSVSETGISKLWEDLLLSFSTLNLMSNSLPCNTVAIKFFDPSGEYILEFLCSRTSTDEEFRFDTISVGLTHADTVIPIITAIATQEN